MMRATRSSRLSWLFCLALLALPLGCGSDKPETGTMTEEPVGIDESNNAMEKFMNQGGGTGKTP